MVLLFLCRSTGLFQTLIIVRRRNGGYCNGHDNHDEEDVQIVQFNLVVARQTVLNGSVPQQFVFIL